MNTISSLFEELQRIRKSPLVDDIQILDLGRYTLKARIYIWSDLLVQVYRNDIYATTNFALILGSKRIYGRDELHGEWHRHSLEDPGLHDMSEDGRKEVNLLEFWQEVEEVLVTLQWAG